MSNRLGPIGPDAMEARLADLATALAFPPTPDLATAVGAKLRSSGAVEAPAGALLARLRLWPVRRSVRRSLLLAAALALLVVGGALAVRFGLELLSIQFGPIPSIAPSPTASGPAAGASRGAETPAPLGAGLRLGQPLALEEASAGAAFVVLVPEDLGPPDIVYLGGPAVRGQVAFLYAPRDDLPASSLLGGAGLLITQNRGEPDDELAHKLADAELARVEPVDVNGARGVWIGGQPHIFWYLASDGTVIQDSRRVVGDTLAWERDGVLYRIEGAITREKALEIARSMR
jgi:hypothetical protein